MATSEVIYLGNLRTRAKHLASGTELITDAPVDNKGKGEFFSPTDLVATAYACCVLTIMGIGAETHGYDITNTKVEVTKIMADNPCRIAEIKTIFTFPADKHYTKKQKITLVNILKTCPVALSLSESLKKTVVLNFPDESLTIE